MTKPNKRHKFFFNTYADCGFTKCLKCDTKTKIRKYALVIGIDVEPKQVLLLNKKCKYCPSCEPARSCWFPAKSDWRGCDLIIAKKQEIESLIPELSKTDYLVLGTMDRQDWVQGNKGSLPPAEMMERMYLFKKEWDFEVIPAGWYPAP